MIKIKKTIQGLLCLTSLSFIYADIPPKKNSTTHSQPSTEVISELPIIKEHRVDTTVGSLPELRENYSCILKPSSTAASKSNIILHCFPTLDFLEHKIFEVPYISCQELPPGEVLLGIFDNPLNRNDDAPYCFIWAIPPQSYKKIISLNINQK